MYKDKDAPKPGIVDLMVAKHRNGEQGTVNLIFKKEYTTFTNSTGDAEAGSLEKTLPKAKEEKPNDVYVPAEIQPMAESGIVDDVFK